MEWLNFIATELHKQFSPLWYADTPDVTKEKQRATLAKRFAYLSETLSTQPYLTGDTFSIADAYLFTILNWAHMVKLDLSPWPALQHFLTRVAARPQVHATVVAEGLAKSISAAA